MESLSSMLKALVSILNNPKQINKTNGRLLSPTPFLRFCVSVDGSRSDGGDGKKHFSEYLGFVGNVTLDAQSKR